MPANVFVLAPGESLFLCSYTRDKLATSLYRHAIYEHLIKIIMNSRFWRSLTCDVWWLPASLKDCSCLKSHMIWNHYFVFFPSALLYLPFPSTLSPVGSAFVFRDLRKPVTASKIYILMFLLQSVLPGEHQPMSEVGSLQSLLISRRVRNLSLNSNPQSKTPAYV